MQQDYVGSSALTSSERRDGKRIRRVGGWHRTILCGALRWTKGFGDPWRTKSHVFVALLSLSACVRRQDGIPRDDTMLPTMMGLSGLLEATIGSETGGVGDAVTGSEVGVGDAISERMGRRDRRDLE